MVKAEAKWLVIKYVPDLMRNEPRNIGVVAIVGDDVKLMMLPRKPRWVKASAAMWRGWLGWFEHLEAERGPSEQWTARRAGDAFYVVEGGWTAGARSAESLAVEMFGRLVL